MPPVLRLSQSVLDDLAQIRDLGTERLTKAKLALSELGDVVDESTLRAALEDVVGAGRVDQVLRSLVGLQPGTDHHDLADASTVVDGVTEALQGQPQGKRWTPAQLKQWITLAPIFASLLDTSCLNILAKAANLRFERDHILIAARVLTDLRPVFTSSSESSLDVAAAVAMHTLRLRYETAGRTRELHVALDGEDLEALISTCQRALQKEGVLAQRLRDAGILDPFNSEEKDR